MTDHAQGIILVTDITKNETEFENSVIKWQKNIEKSFTNQVPMILVQNKSDLLDSQEKHRYHEIKESKKFAKTHGFVTVVQTSAKNNQNLEKIFEKLFKAMQKRGFSSAENREEITLKSNENKGYFNCF